MSPLSVGAGTTVTITGSGFGATQGTGQVWIGTAPGVVQSWSATQIVAQVAAGSATGVVQVLNNGSASGVVEFTVNSLPMLSASPVTGGAGTTVTLAGTGFGATQGAGFVTLGSTAGTVVSWSDTSITATVAAGSISGVARVQAGSGALSNALGFKIPGSPTSASMIAPSMLNMLVGDSRSLQALSQTGQPMLGLTWTLQLLSASPVTGGAGTTVTLAGTGFGATQGIATLGSAAGTVVSWSDTSITATVASGSISGVARVQVLSGALSNALGFKVPGSPTSASLIAPSMLRIRGVCRR